jgi:RNA polymerase sigma-70 factor (ECF subfamily)
MYALGRADATFVPTMKNRAGRLVEFGSGSGASPTVIESFESFYAREYRRVLALAFVLSGSRAQAEDLTQDAFTAALKAWPQINNPDGWIRTAVSNKAISFLRHAYAAKRALTLLQGQAVSEPDLPEDTTAFWAEVRRLPRRQAQAITLFYLEGLSAEEVGAVLGCGASTVRIHLSRGRRKLAERIEVTA